MFCQICNKKSATVHYTELSGEKRFEIHVCQDCAGKQGLFEGAGDSVSTGFPAGSRDEGAGRHPPENICSACGTGYADFKSSGRLGCGACYDAFRRNLAPLLRKIHGGAKHSGKAPASSGGEAGRRVFIASQKERLERLVKEERFEEAARLRDFIQGLEEARSDAGAGGEDGG